MSDRKRPLEGNGAAPAAKKQRSDNTTSSNGSISAPPISAEDLIKQKRAEVAAKLAAFRNGPGAAAGSSTNAIATPGAGVTGLSSSAMSAMAKSIAEAKKKVASQGSKQNPNPYMAQSQAGKGKNRATEAAPQGAGLKMSVHPSLLDTAAPSAPQSKKDRYKPMQPKFASIKANARNAPTPPPVTVHVPIMKENPYAAASASPAPEGSFEGAPRERVGRSLRFNPKGKYIAQADNLRKEAQLEALKQRIAESAKKAGLDNEFDTLEKKIKREVPPRSEWWDEALLPTKNYEDIDNFDPSALNIRKDGSPITFYIQHPIPIPAPGEKNKPVAKPLMLTKKEQKKMRKQRRQAELQDKRDRVRMGLIPPDAPKVRLANLMKVLTSDAVQDPTRVEAKVRREVAMRKHTHEKMNTERKLTDEQRGEKIETKKVEEEKKGIYGAIFKIRTLADPAQRFKVRKNAEQLNLTGLAIFNPSFCMVYVEGAAKYIRNYKRLMLHRIAWTEAARARGEEEVELEQGDDAIEANGAQGKGKEKAVEQEIVSLENNRCDLVWEGPVRDRSFSNFRPKPCPTDNAAREALGAKLTGYWDMTKNWKPEDEEFI